MQTIQEVSKETLAIEQYLSTKKEGEELTYATIQVNTGVKMDNRGKQFLRTALKRLKLQYEVFKGQGIRLLCSDNAQRIVAHKVIKIDGATRRAEKTTKQVIKSPVYAKIDNLGQQRLTVLAAMFGSIRSFSNSAKKIFSSQNIKIGEPVR